MIEKEIYEFVINTDAAHMKQMCIKFGYYNRILEVTDFLDNIYNDIPFKQRIYHIKNKIYKIIKCPICKINPAKWGNHRKYDVTCSEECRIKKLTDTQKEKYGDFYSNTDEFKLRYKNTSLERYNVDHCSKSDKVKQKMSNTNIEKYGTKSSFQNKKVRDKFKSNMIKKYGVDNPVKLENIKNKIESSGVLYKPYRFPSGLIIKIQGFEYLALDELINLYKEDDIIVGRLNIEKFTNKIIYDKNKTYYPDIYIKSENKIIEVKSIWTFNKHKSKNLLKQQACLIRGFKFEFWIYDRKKIKSILHLPHVSFF